jgi:isopentenyl phosphate kinase
VRPVLLIKLGGSLITDKRRPETARAGEIARLAAELAAGLPRARERGLAVVVGHGSGSFGHVAADRHRLAGGLADPAQLPGVGVTQARAAALHRLVLDAFAAAGLAAFSVAPSSAAVADGETVRLDAEPVALALAAGLLPVLYGDVVMHRQRGVAICSTERAFAALAAALPAHGWRASAALWLGDTAGLLDAVGRTVPEVAPGRPPAVPAGGAAGTDVTGGMAHRLATALALAEAGVESWLADGAVPGLLGAFLAGGRVPGTRVAPAGG